MHAFQKIVQSLKGESLVKTRLHRSGHISSALLWSHNQKKKQNLVQSLESDNLEKTIPILNEDMSSHTYLDNQGTRFRLEF